MYLLSIAKVTNKSVIPNNNNVVPEGIEPPFATLSCYVATSAVLPLDEGTKKTCARLQAHVLGWGLLSLLGAGNVDATDGRSLGTFNAGLTLRRKGVFPLADLDFQEGNLFSQ